MAHETNVAGDTEFSHECGVTSRIGSSVVIDVVHGDVQPSFEGEQKKSRRIRTTRDGEVDRAATRWKGAEAQQR